MQQQPLLRPRNALRKNRRSNRQGVEALLRYYQKVGSKDVESTTEPPPFQDNADVLIQPKTKK
tara:strand:- start:95 stop:283 length:189 start_codon:yes stop_codon:yes gene_type:complete